MYGVLREDAMEGRRVWNKHYYRIWKGVLLGVGVGWDEGGSNF
jgi:hypothetical protein